MDLIDREQTIKHIQDKLVEAQMYSIGFLAEVYDDIARHHIAQWINEIPSARPKGKWIKGMSENGVTTSLFCSNCGCENSHWYDWNFCPNCGSEMQEVE